MKNVTMFVVFVVLLVAALTKAVWFNMLTEHTREANTESKIVFLELSK